MAKKNKVEDQTTETTETTEVQAPDPVAVADAQAAVAEAEMALKIAKDNLKALVGKSAVTRGPVGVGAFIKERITEGLSNAEILQLVAENFPANHTNINCINWYRNALKNWPDGKRPSKKVQAEPQDSSESQEAQEEVQEKAA